MDKNGNVFSETTELENDDRKPTFTVVSMFVGIHPRQKKI